MTKKLLLAIMLLVGLMLVSCTSAAATTQPPSNENTAANENTATNENTSSNNGEVVTLTMGSWRADDVDAMNKVLAAFTAAHPNIKVEFDPTNPPEYNAALQIQFEGGT